MRKCILFLILALFSFSLCLPVNAGSATLSLNTAKTALKVGDVFKVSVNINSGGNVLQVVRAKISYPADLIQAQGFTLGTLFPQKSPGEKIGGGIIYSGGYLIGDGTSANGLLGTATFKALKPGVAAISLISGSRLITPEPIDIYSGGNSITITLSAAEKPVKPTDTIALVSPVISSATNPEDTWSNINGASFTWSQPANSQGYIFKLSSEPFEDIGDEISATTNSHTYADLADGILIFQLKAKYPAGFSELSNYTIKIDTVPPRAMAPSIEAQKISENKNNYLIFFNTTDELSGIKSYQLQFDNNQFKEADSPYQLTDEESKSTIVTIKALDNAGNNTTVFLPIYNYIQDQENALLQLQQAKKALFDIQAQTAQRSWLDFYLVIAVVLLSFMAIILWIIFKKRK